MDNLYTHDNNLYGVTISTDGVDVDFTDPTEGPKEIPDITGHANEFLKVNSNATNIEWAEIGGDGDFSCDNCQFGSGSVANPSITFKTDTNTGLSNPSSDTLSISTNGIKRLDINNSAIDVGTIANPLNINVNGSFTQVPITLTTASYNFNVLTSDSYILNTNGGNFVINLQISGTENIGRTIRFYKNNINNEIRFFASGGNVRLNSPIGTQTQANAGQFTNVPNGSTFFWMCEIIQETTSNYKK